jgi:hypothetical protein
MPPPPALCTPLAQRNLCSGTTSGTDVETSSAGFSVSVIKRRFNIAATLGTACFVPSRDTQVKAKLTFTNAPAQLYSSLIIDHHDPVNRGRDACLKEGVVLRHAMRRSIIAKV